MEEKIKAWEAELEQTLERQRAMNQKSQERVRMLRKRIQEAKAQLELLHNQRIAETVRSVYGEITEENLTEFLQRMKQLKQFKEEGPPSGQPKTAAGPFGDGR